MIAKADTPEARRIWRTVARVAEECPEHLRDRIDEAAKDEARRILESWEDQP